MFLVSFFNFVQFLLPRNKKMAKNCVKDLPVLFLYDASEYLREFSTISLISEIVLLDMGKIFMWQYGFAEIIANK